MLLSRDSASATSARLGRGQIVLSAVPVQRLLDGVAAALRTDVRPHITDPFALMQLRAIDEVLINLAERVDWSLADVAEETDEIERMLARLRKAGWLGDRVPGDAPSRPQAESVAPSADTLQRRSEALFSLRDALIWLEQLPVRDETAVAARSAAVEFLRTATARERGRLKSGMYT